MKKINKKRISKIFSIVLISFVIFSFLASNVNAEINPKTNDFFSGLGETMNDLTEWFTDIAISSAFSGLASLLGGLAIAIFMTFALTFMSYTGSVPPTPDSIVFNNVAILDINFFNPNQQSILGLSDDLIPKLYNSFHAIAISVFIIAAMLAGIKMALSTLASEKAAAKKAMIDWFVGIVVLFLLRLIIAGLFEINEFMVYKISDLTEQVNFNVYLISHQKQAKLFGLSWADLVNFIGMFFGDPDIAEDMKVELPGFFGLMAMNAVQGLQGNIFSSIILFILFGQTITLLISYSKRLIYTIILGIAGPLVVAVDAINKSTKGQSTVFSNWFKELVSNVFMQTFHSVLMLMTLIILGKLSQDSKEQWSPIISIISIVLVSGIIKFEKTYKQLFGISDGMFGNFKGQTAKLMAGVHGAATAVKAIGDNTGKVKKAYNTIGEATKTKQELVHERGEIYYTNFLNNLETAAKVDPSKRDEYMSKAREARDNAIRDGYSLPESVNKMVDALESGADKVTSKKAIVRKVNRGDALEGGAERATSQKAIVRKVNRDGATGPVYTKYNSTSSNFENSYSNSTNGTRTGIANNSQNIQKNTQNISNSSNTSNSRGDDSNNIQRDILGEIKRLRNEIRSEDRINSVNKEIEKADKQIKSATSDLVSAGLATVMGPANTLMGVGIGLGSGDDLSETLAKGGYVTAGLDKASENIGKQVGRVVSGEFKDAMKKYDKHSTIDSM